MIPECRERREALPFLLEAGCELRVGDLARDNLPVTLAGLEPAEGNSLNGLLVLLVRRCCC